MYNDRVCVVILEVYNGVSRPDSALIFGWIYREYYANVAAIFYEQTTLSSLNIATKLSINV